MASKRWLSVAQIRALKPKDESYRIVDGNGLGLEVSARGTLSWRVRFRLNGRPGKINIGRYPTVSLAEARAENSRIQGSLASGVPPEQMLTHRRSRRKTHSFKEFAEKYMADVVAKVRKEPKSVRRYLERDIYPAFGDRPLNAVNAVAVRELVFARRDEGRPQAAIALRNLLKRIFDYAIICGAAISNPTAAVPSKFIARATPRERALSEPEIALFLRKLRDSNEKPPIKSALELVLMTLVRKSELRLACGHHLALDRSEWEIPPELSKTGKGQIIYLSRQAKQLFEQLGHPRGYLFPHRATPTQPMAPNTLNSALARVTAGMIHFTVHDLRRTAATRLTEMGFDPDVVEKAMNHKIKGVRGVYNRAQYADQRRQMLQAWADHLDYLGKFGDLLNS